MSMHDRTTAVVIGGSRGIGASVAKRLSKNRHVIVGYRLEKVAADDVVEQIRDSGGSAESLQIDVSSDESLQSAAQSFQTAGEIDALVCCAGIEHFNSVADLTRSECLRVFNTNTIGQIMAVTIFSPLLSKGGRIVLSSSVSARISVADHGVYAASKGAVEAFVRNAARDLAKMNISINCVAPGAVMTDMARSYASRYIPDGFDPDQWRAVSSAAGRISQPDEVARAYEWIATCESDFMTGATLAMDGGRG